jgi:hypothetical protein
VFIPDPDFSTRILDLCPDPGCNNKKEEGKNSLVVIWAPTKVMGWIGDKDKLTPDLGSGPESKNPGFRSTTRGAMIILLAAVRIRLCE